MQNNNDKEIKDTEYQSSPQVYIPAYPSIYPPLSQYPNAESQDSIAHSSQPQNPMKTAKYWGTIIFVISLILTVYSFTNIDHWWFLHSLQLCSALWI